MLAVAGLSQAMGVEPFSGWILDTKTIAITSVKLESQGGGGGGYSNFSSYVGSDPASTVQLKKISGISSTPKKYLKF